MHCHPSKLTATIQYLANGAGLLLWFAISFLNSQKHHITNHSRALRGYPWELKREVFMSKFTYNNKLFYSDN